ncbi:hypothetical protein D1646_06635 [Pseudoflavonifractor sp. 60]|uniref:hypothetical protein n=1 Tax=Pseudoflavonifractor sp. 60 TaxID=2304576 RepID=UPI001368906E|nr:hypothetical protein [Pseudoflavonifractor sp. 60]NBI66496.1 hypothetical protein [Pseudoflavonifractor sp. 60]
MDKKQREERRRQEDIALQRGLLWVVGAIVLEGLLVLINRNYINYKMEEAAVNRMVAIGNVLGVLRIAGAVAAVLALGWAFWQMKQKKTFGLQLVLALALAAVAVCAHVTVKFRAEGMSMLFWLVVAWAVLALVYYIYQREFFLGACACGMSALGLWFARMGSSGLKETILVLAAIVVVTGAVLLLKKSDGLLPLPGMEPVRFLAPDTCCTVPLATCLASLAAVVVGIAAGGMVAYYLIYVMVAWLFALFVYYTVKLM